MNHVIRSLVTQLSVSTLVLARPSYDQTALTKGTTSTSEYRLELDIDPGREVVEVHGSWRIPASSWHAAPGDSLRFQITPLAQNLRFGVRADQVNDTPVCHRDGGDLTCALFTARAPRALYFSYDFEAADAPQMRVTKDQAFAGGNGELWYPQIAFSRRDRGVIKCVVPPQWHCFVTGDSTSLVRLKDRRIFVSYISTPVKFAFAAAPFQVIDAGRIRLLTLKAWPNASVDAQRASESLRALELRYGTLPYPRLSLIEIRFGGRVLGTSEFGAIFCDSSQLAKPFDLSYWAHEMAHQWWGDLVRTQSGTPGQMLMTEGLAQYSAVRVVDELAGAESSARFRTQGLLNPKQSINGYVDLVGHDSDLALGTTLPKNQEETLRMHRLANSKGMMVLWMLSNELGEKHFDRVLRAFARDHADAPTSWAEFEDYVARSARPKKVDWFFLQWTTDIGLPQLKVDWSQRGDAVQVRVIQCGPVYRLDGVPVRITFEDSSQIAVQRHLTVSRLDETFQLGPLAKVLHVEFDHSHQFLWAGCPERTGVQPSSSP